MKIVFIPDTQVRQGVPTEHILAAGRYVVEHKPDVVVVAGDWWDMPSLSVFNTHLQGERARILSDIKAGVDAMNLFLSPLELYNKKRKKNKKKTYNPRLVYTVGNHDPQVRIPRLVEGHPILEGFLKDRITPYLEGKGFEVVDFLDIIDIEGIRFSHYFCNPHSAKKTPLGGMIDTQIKNAGFSFVQGHTQGLKMGKHYLSDGTRRIGIAAGSFYQHEETYMGPQGNNHWHGIIQLNEVKRGGADICEISLDYLLRKYL